MNNPQSIQRRAVERPHRALRDEFVEPILVLAARMPVGDPSHRLQARSMVERLAGLTGRSGLRERVWTARLTERDACQRLTTPHARRAALVVLSLVLKTDSEGGSAAKAYFSRLREQLGLLPVVVPASVEEHLRLALEYLRD